LSRGLGDLYKREVLNYVNSARQKKQELNIPDIAASFQASVVDVLTIKTMAAAKKAGVSKIALAGGVAANSALRQAFVDKCADEGFDFYYPSLKLCTDNAAMIGCVAYYDYLKGVRGDLNVNAIPNLRIGDK
jgi:N6-L-threonylcarbamoyladenine synthase